MSLFLEWKKQKRTGYVTAYAGCGLLAAAFPLINTGARPETFLSLPGNPLEILMNANWQMIAMLNILVSILGACLMYHTEYAEKGWEKMSTLPVHTGKLFLGKCILATLGLAVLLFLEFSSLTICQYHWFPQTPIAIKELLSFAGFQFMTTLPTVILMLVIASACESMWVSLGIGVILLFTFSIFPQENLVLSLLPFSSPFQLFSLAQEQGWTSLFIWICLGEAVIFILGEGVYQKIRRSFS